MRGYLQSTEKVIFQVTFNERLEKISQGFEKFVIFLTSSNLLTANTFASSVSSWLELYITIIKAPSVWFSSHKQLYVTLITDFTLLDFGSYGSNSSYGVSANSAMGEAFKSWELSHDGPLNGCKFCPLPYFLLGDDIFVLKKWSFKTFLWQELGREGLQLQTFTMSSCNRKYVWYSSGTL